MDKGHALPETPWPSCEEAVLTRGSAAWAGGGGVRTERRREGARRAQRRGPQTPCAAVCAQDVRYRGGASWREAQAGRDLHTIERRGRLEPKVTSPAVGRPGGRGPLQLGTGVWSRTRTPAGKVLQGPRGGRRPPRGQLWPACRRLLWGRGLPAGSLVPRDPRPTDHWASVQPISN